MGNQNIMSLVLFRAVGQNSGIPANRLGPLSIASYMLGNPIVAMMLARSGQFAGRGIGSPALPAPPEPSQDVLAAAKSAEAALGSSKNAENAAKAAAESEAKAKEFAETATKAAADAVAAAKGGKNP